MNRISIFLFSLLLGSAVAPAQTPSKDRGPAEEAPFADVTDVVAVDRMIGLDTHDVSGFLRGGKLPRGIAPDDFHAVVTGDEDAGLVELPVVGLESVVRGLPEEVGTWTVVVLVDGTLASTRTVRWGCRMLAERAEALARLGQVTIATARPEPATVLPATGDAVAVEQMLSRLALVAEGDDEVLSRRWRWVEEPGAAEGYSAAEAESFTVRGALDARLLYWTGVARKSGPRRLLIWLTDGFDLRTAPFYGAGSEPVASDGSSLEDHARDVERALATDGWIVVPLRPPEEDPYRGRAAGVRIGKWRFMGFPPFVAGVRDPGYDPKQAEAYLDLGDQRLRTDDFEGAADAYDQAYYHFWNEPKHSDRQAVALLRLADCLERLDDADGARRARALATELDAEIAARHLAVDTVGDTVAARPDVARRLDPDASLLRLASATSGELVTDGQSLDDRLLGLSRRLRLTLQLQPELAQGVHRLEITWRGVAVRAPVWIRVGDPPALRDARRRRGE